MTFDQVQAAIRNLGSLLSQREISQLAGALLLLCRGQTWSHQESADTACEYLEDAMLVLSDWADAVDAENDE